eukprot:11171293-Lingulodinium_polyedra.AAC.1
MGAAAQAAGCAVLRPTPRGLWRGGASHDSVVGLRTLLGIQFRGKWRSTLSARVCEKHAWISEQLERLQDDM